MLSYSTRGTIVYIEWRQPLHVYTFFLLYIFKCSWNVVINKTRPVVIYWILTLGPWTIYHASLFWYDTNFYKVYWRALSLLSLTIPFLTLETTDTSTLRLGPANLHRDPHYRHHLQKQKPFDNRRHSVKTDG